jgi:hypothetical protein
MNTAPRANGAPSADTPAARPDEPPIQDKKWHDARGRFVRGNPGGPGNPFARRTALYQKAIRQVVTLEDMREVMTMVLLKAKSGDLAAVKILTAHTAGKGVPAVDADRLDIDEWQLTVAEAVDARDMKAVMTRLPVERANDFVRGVLPTLGDEMLEMLRHVASIADPKAVRRWIKKQRHKAERAQREAERARRRAERAQQQVAENADPSATDENGQPGSPQRPEYPQHPECMQTDALPSSTEENGQSLDRHERARSGDGPSPIGNDLSPGPETAVSGGRPPITNGADRGEPRS